MRDPLDGERDSPALGRLKRRADFLHAGRGRRWHGKALSVQGPGSRGDDDAARIGFTLTKKVGCSVVRNRARRRLREAVRLASGLPARPGCDYVVVGRLDAIRLPFDALQRELARGIAAVHESRGPRTRDRQGGGRVQAEGSGRAPPERIRPPT